MKVVGVVVLLLLVILCIPFVGPAIGLATFLNQAESPGRSVAVQGVLLNVYEHHGDKRDVVLVHGHPGSAQMMQPLAFALQALGYRVFRYDRAGWGHSAQHADGVPVNPTRHARDLLALVAHERLHEPLFVGYSYGGGVVMEANRLQPAVVGDVALISSVGKRPPARQPSLLGRLMGSPLFLRWAFGTDLTARQGAAAISAQFMYPQTPLPGTLEGFLATLALPDVPTNWQREGDERYVNFDDYRPNEVRGCVLVVHGDQDQVVSVDIAHYLASSIPAAQLHLVAGGGHGMILAQPDALALRVAAHDRSCRAEQSSS